TRHDRAVVGLLEGRAGGLPPRDGRRADARFGSRGAAPRDRRTPDAGVARDRRQGEEGGRPRRREPLPHARAVQGPRHAAGEAGHCAERVVLKEAYRDPAALTPWPIKPEAFLREARLLRAEIAAIHAAREIAGGRFDFGRRLALRAAALDAANVQATKLVQEA